MEKYTVATPYKAFRPASEVADLNAKFDDWCANRGGVAVWDKALIEAPYGAQVLTPANDEDGTPNKCPGWQWNRSPSVVITARGAIQAAPLAVMRTVVREYVPLHLFLAAARSADVAVTLVGVNGEPVEDCGRDYTTVVMRWSREVYDGNGYRAGREEYAARLEVVPKGEHDHYPTPKSAARWMVRIDSLDAELVEHPDEPEVVWGYMTQDNGFLPHEDELDDDETSWERGVEIDGEFLTEEEFESWEGGYYPPEDDFVWEEANHRLEAVLRIGAHDVYDHDLKGFVTLDAWGVRIDG